MDIFFENGVDHVSSLQVFSLEIKCTVVVVVLHLPEELECVHVVLAGEKDNGRSVLDPVLKVVQNGVGTYVGEYLTDARHKDDVGGVGFAELTDLGDQIGFAVQNTLHGFKEFALIEGLLFGEDLLKQSSLFEHGDGELI